MGISIEMFKFYEVGGKIRDELLGLTNKDVDYVAVPTEACYSSIHPRESQPSPARLVFQALKSYLEEQKFEIFLVTPDCYTIRAKFPEGYKYQGVADFVMARKEVGYIPNTTWSAIKAYDYESKMYVVSEERIREELVKCFKCDTLLTLEFLNRIPQLRDYIFKNTNLWLKPTSEK